jgi:hypothetical protein
MVAVIRATRYTRPLPDSDNAYQVGRMTIAMSIRLLADSGYTISCNRKLTFDLKCPVLYGLAPLPRPKTSTIKAVRSTDQFRVILEQPSQCYIVSKAFDAIAKSSECLTPQ